MDVLTNVLDSLRLKGSVYCRSHLENPWNLRFLEHGMAVFHVVEHGEAWLQLAGSSDALHLVTGDLVLLPHGTAHSIGARDAQATPKSQVPTILMTEFDQPRVERWSNSPDTVLLCGTFSLEHGDHPLLSLLPDQVHVPGQTEWLETVRLMTREVDRSRPGMELMVRRLADVLFIQTIRHWLEGQDAMRHKGWLAALRDPKISQALELIHAQPEHDWTVASLAEKVRLSRAAFASRFTELVGEPPLTYLTRWRMSLASRLLRQSKYPMLEVANRSGYGSEVAFHRAFKRVTGTTPGAYRRRQQARVSG